MTENKEEIIIFRLTEEDRRKIHEKMDGFGIQNMSAYIRKMAIDGYCINLDLGDVRQMVNLLSRCGNNLNQYAKKANETGSIYHEDIEELRTNQKEILQEMRKVLDRLTAIM